MEELERTSGLKAPNILLTGHEGDVYALEFSPDGQFLATAGKDKTILLFQVYGECLNFCVLDGHKNAVLELHWSAAGDLIYSCSADHTAAVWDVEYRKRIKNLSGHSEIVNSCCPARKVVGSSMLVTGSDDGTVKIWDTRSKNPAKSISQDFQVLAVSADANGERVFSGGIDNVIRAYDVRSEKELFTLQGCMDSVTSLDTSEDGTSLLSNSMDQRLVVWDIQPFCHGDNRMIATLFGPTHNAEMNLIRARWGKNTLVCSGSADHMVYILDSKDQRLLYKLPGHLGSVNDVCMHPTEPIIASASSDKCVYLGELA